MHSWVLEHHARCHSNLDISIKRRVISDVQMTLENLLSQMGMGTKEIGIGTKQLSERYSEYGAPADQHVFYTYEPSSPAHAGASKHTYSGGGLKSNASMSALTLLAFLFFLHILQQCIKEHMNDMSSSPVMVMTAGRESDSELSNKIDKAGLTDSKTQKYKDGNEIGQKINRNQMNDAKNPFNQNDYLNENKLTKIDVAEYSPKIDRQKYEYIYKSYANRSSMYPGFVTAVDDE